MAILVRTSLTVSIFVDINNRTRKRRGNVSRRPPTRKDARIPRAVLGQRGRVERRVRFGRVLLIRSRLMNIERVVGVEDFVDGNGLPHLIDPWRKVVPLRRHCLAVHVGCVVAVHVSPRSDADGPREILASGVGVGHAGLE